MYRERGWREELGLFSSFIEGPETGNQPFLRSNSMIVCHLVILLFSAVLSCFRPHSSKVTKHKTTYKVSSWRKRFSSTGCYAWKWSSHWIALALIINLQTNTCCLTPPRRNFTWTPAALSNSCACPATRISKQECRHLFYHQGHRIDEGRDKWREGEKEEEKIGEPKTERRKEWWQQAFSKARIIALLYWYSRISWILPLGESLVFPTVLVFSQPLTHHGAENVELPWWNPCVA